MYVGFSFFDVKESPKCCVFGVCKNNRSSMILLIMRILITSFILGTDLFCGDVKDYPKCCVFNEFYRFCWVVKDYP